MGVHACRNLRMAERIGATEVRYAPQRECGVQPGEPEFLDIIRRHDVRLVCCAHGLGFDQHVRDGVQFVMSGCGGAALNLSYRHAGGRNRGALFHAVEITLTEAGEIRGRVFRPSRHEAARRHSLSAASVVSS